MSAFQAALYGRVSSDQQAQAQTIQSQLEALRARIQTDGGLPIATGENLHMIYEFQKMIAGRGVSFPEPDLSNIGGNVRDGAHLASIGGTWMFPYFVNIKLRSGIFKKIQMRQRFELAQVADGIRL